ncbi:non-ribosomal peptide synthetase, partial [Fastidiosibacter lacustris]|uniref:non-ribosomal peptide synthetase n=1 Tax=Fastidiosibacter lacustris TaxID=2056695 RepID=UPI000E355BF2
DKSLEIIIGILGILKSGAAYVPIDPSYPDERIRYILDDTQVSLLLTQSHYLSRLKMMTNSQLIPLDSNSYKGFPFDNLLPQNTSHDLAYVIYTSGTTGQPKGTCITHQNLNNLIMVQREKLNINETSRFLQFSSISFDASVWEIFSALSFGARLYVISNTTKINPEHLNQYIFKHQINTALLPPPILKVLSTGTLDCLQYLLTGGEACSYSTMTKWSVNRNFINAYGPTEITVCATMHDYNNTSLYNNIGKPLNNAKCYVVDRYSQPVPIGVVGELYIGGAGVACGYLNKPELTAEKFITNPFATEEDKQKGYDRLYKTGDLVRWLPDGNLEYIGRKDTQVKIRGFRIELGEIENALINIEGIDQAVVMMRMVNDDQHLFAYYVASYAITPKTVLDRLTSKLPHYMVPSAALQIDKIPLTINGKIDVKALPDIVFSSHQTYIAPTTEQQRLICQAFLSVLLIEKVGIDDDFFTLGGNSIKAIQLAVTLQANFDIAVSEIFDLR